MDIQQYSNFVGNLDKQYRFAASQTLNQIAFRAQKIIRTNLKQKFNLKNTFVQRSIRVGKSHKNQAEIKAKIYSDYGFIAEHEKGHTRTVSQIGVRSFAMPTDDFFIITGRPKNKKIPKSLTAKGILRRKVKGVKPFIISFNSNEAGIMVKPKGSRHNVLLYWLTNKPMRFKRRDWFEPVIDKTYKRLIRPLFNKNLKNALASSVR